MGKAAKIIKLNDVTTSSNVTSLSSYCLMFLFVLMYTKSSLWKTKAKNPGVWGGAPIKKEQRPPSAKVSLCSTQPPQKEGT